MALLKECYLFWVYHLGGKVKLIEKGAFQNTGIAMMAHPCPSNNAMPITLAIL